MVNEINKSTDPSDNQQLGQRLADSGSALAEMQAEHHQLLAEMEQLRLRAEQLQVMRSQGQSQAQVEQSRSEQYEESFEQTATSSIAKSTAIQQMSSKSVSVQEISGTEGDDSDEAEYIKKKLAEIAQLKSQFKNVQNMINTTEMIEKHLAKHESISETIQSESSSSLSSMKQQSIEMAEQTESVKTATSSKLSSMKQQSIEVAQQTSSSTSSQSIMEATSSSSKAVMQSVTSSSTVSVEEEIEESVATSGSGTAITGSGDEKEQLLVAMLDMFQDFNTDLKSQAENLKAERERIKALKENIIESRQESKDEESK